MGRIPVYSVSGFVRFHGDQLFYVTIFHCSLGRSHKTGLTVHRKKWKSKYHHWSLFSCSLNLSDDIFVYLWNVKLKTNVGWFLGFILYWTGLLTKTNSVNKNVKYNIVYYQATRMNKIITSLISIIIWRYIYVIDMTLTKFD